jgi:hypothetical protein
MPRLTLVLLILALTGCGAPAASPSPAMQAATQAVAVPTQPAQPTPNLEATIQAAVKATVQAQPTATVAPVATATPEPGRMTRDDYRMAPLVGEGTRFLIPSLCPDDCGGRIFTGPPADLELLRTYYTELGRASAAFYSHVFVRDNVLVQINGELPDEKAKQYEDALKAMK